MLGKNQGKVRELDNKWQPCYSLCFLLVTENDIEHALVKSLSSIHFWEFSNSISKVIAMCQFPYV